MISRTVLGLHNGISYDDKLEGKATGTIILTERNLPSKLFSPYSTENYPTRMKLTQIT